MRGAAVLMHAEQACCCCAVAQQPLGSGPELYLYKHTFAAASCCNLHLHCFVVRFLERTPPCSAAALMPLLLLDMRVQSISPHDVPVAKRREFASMHRTVSGTSTLALSHSQSSLGHLSWPVACSGPATGPATWQATDMAGAASPAREHSRSCALHAVECLTCTLQPSAR